MQHTESDFLHGAAAIARFLGMSNRRAYYALERGDLPAFKIGSIWTARKSTLLEDVARREAESRAEVA